jgi:hypothetical protein
MNQVRFDGIYGEGDTWLSGVDIQNASEIAKLCLDDAVLHESADIPDLDEWRARRPTPWKQ